MRLTGSRIRLAKTCGYWARPEVDAPPDSPSRPALMGSALHALVEHNGDVSACVDKLSVLEPAESETVADWFSAWLESPASKARWEHEVAFAYDPHTDSARTINTGGHRDYSQAMPTEIVGTADLVCLDSSGNTVFVADIKTGFGANSEPVHEHSQLRFLALAAARTYMVDFAVISIFRIDSNGLVATEHMLNAADLDGICAATRSLVARIPDSKPQPGAHCSSLYCPAIAVCPATTQLAVRGLGEVARREWGLTTPTCDEHALYLRDGAEVLSDLAERMKTAAREYADKKNGIALPNGKIWRKVEQERETISLNGPGGAEAQDIIQRAAPGAVEVNAKSSKEAIKRAIAKQQKLSPKELNAALEQVLVQLRAAGAVRSAAITRYEERNNE